MTSGNLAHRYFFVHVMKTGGATLRQHIYANFAPGEVYPVAGIDHPDEAWLIDYLFGLPPERLDGFRAFTGHFPYVVAELLDARMLTLSLVRDPVERTVSYLKHCKRLHPEHRDLAFEAIYEDPFTFPCLIREHQTKIFSMTEYDKLESHLDVIEVDDRRLELAKANIEQVDVLGLQEHHAEFADELRSRFGWRFDPLPDRRVSRAPWQVSEALRRRIAEDNPYDRELYEHARGLLERRRARRRTA